MTTPTPSPRSDSPPGGTAVERKLRSKSMTDTTEAPPKKGPVPRGCLLILVSWLIIWASNCISKMATWSDPWEGLTNGVLFGLMLGLLFVPLLVVILGPIYLIVRKTRLSARTQSLIVLAPAILLAALQVGSLVVSPPTAGGRFQWMMGTPLPEEARDFKAHYSGGGLTDFSDMYYFSAGPAAVERLLKTRKYVRIENAHLSEESPLPMSGERPRPGWPSPVHWSNYEVYKYATEKWYYYIITDGSHTKVFIVAGCI